MYGKPSWHMADSTTWPSWAHIDEVDLKGPHAQRGDIRAATIADNGVGVCQLHEAVVHLHTPITTVSEAGVTTSSIA